MSEGKSHDLLLEIGCEELPSSFVEVAVATLPELARKRLEAARIGHGAVKALGTPRRLALYVSTLAASQRDLAEEVTGPPVRAAFKDGKPTRAAEAFAEKLGVSVDQLRKVDTPKGEYLVGSRSETGKPTHELLPALLEAIVRDIPFRKSMRWGDLDFAFGRPIQWLVALFGAEVVPLELASKRSGRASRGHRFLATGEVTLASPGDYLETMRDQHVLVDPAERREALVAAVARAAKQAGGDLIEDEFLVGENLSLVEEPHVVVGSFDPSFLELPERVILEVAKGHQRYFGVRGADGRLLPRYLAVVNTALEPELIVKGNDRVMRARLADAQFFYREDLKVPLADKRDKLAGVVFQKRLGSVLEKSDRVERLALELGQALAVDAGVVETARAGAHLAKCDLVSFMVGEFPELQGDMGASYAVAQGVPAPVAEVIREHYRPKGAQDEPAASPAAALVAIADRLDTVVGCFGIGLVPTGTADPFGLRRAVLGILRTMLERNFDMELPAIFAIAHAGFDAKKLDVPADALSTKLLEFAGERLRGLLSDRFPADVVRACLASGHARPLDLRRRIAALAELDESTRAQVGEVFKRATNIAKDATAGEPSSPPAGAHASEMALFSAYERFAVRSNDLGRSGDYAALLREVATIAPVMHQYFIDVFVLDKDQAIRDNRLRLMRSIADRCARVAHLELLAPS